MLSPNSDGTLASSATTRRDASSEHRRDRRVTLDLRMALLMSLAAFAQAPRSIQVVVRDESGAVVPYAVVSVFGGIPVIASDKGIATVGDRRTDSTQVYVRRIGYREFVGWIRADTSGRTVVSLAPIAQNIDALLVSERALTPLARTGFYDRAERVRTGAIVGDFITPEQLEARSPSSVSRILQAGRYVRVSRVGVRPVILGRGGCAMTILLDGQRVPDMIEEVAREETPTSIDRGGTRQNQFKRDADFLDVDQIVDGASVMAIEIYPSTANAPAELQTLGGRGSCGIVAIWTGPRR